MILKKKIFKIKKRQGRSYGVITVRHRGGGNKRKIRIIKNSRTLENIKGIIKSIEYDPNRNTFLLVVFYSNGDKNYIIKPKFLDIGDCIYFGENVSHSPGNSTYLRNLNIGDKIYDIEYAPYSKTKVARSGESFATILNKTETQVVLLLPSREIRFFNQNCIAYLGIPELRKSKKKNNAGKSRRLGIRPTVRGTAMNAVDHPHGGGEGKSPIGRKAPMTPWGKKTLGFKTSKKRKNILILKTRKNK